MLDIKWIRENPNEFDELMRKRKSSFSSNQILSFDTKHRYALTELQKLQSRRNDIAKQFAIFKKEGKDFTLLSQEGEEIKNQIEQSSFHAAQLDNELKNLLLSIPNTLSKDVPEGMDENDNVEIKCFGKPRPDATPPHHFIAKELGLMDFERAAKISGSRFVVLYGLLAKLERVLARFMLDIHTEKFGYLEVYPPVLVKDEAMIGTGQLPKFRDDQFHTSHGLWLIPTAEVVLTNLVAKETLENLPLRFVAYTPCFRAEAGASGRDTQGMIRQHQFGKVELVSIVKPQDSQSEHERMLGAACSILEALDLPYRVVNLCSGDIGFGAKKTYDIEVWLPSEQKYREISSCSRCGDFQARRMNTRYREDDKLHFVHTLNGSGLAVGRTLIAVIENYYQNDGSIKIPEVLQNYFGEIKKITKIK